MNVLIVLESAAILLMGILLAGLLRSHAEILRRLHDLGAGDADHHVFRSHAPAPSTAASGQPIVGTAPDGAALTIGVGRAAERTLVLFLTSGCSRCGQFWSALAAGAHDRLTGTRTIVVARDPSEESPSRIAELAPEGVIVVHSSAAWHDYRVPGSPYAVVVAGGAVTGEGTAPTWETLISLVMQAEGDAGEARADRALHAAGIHPGDASLYPAPRQR